LPFAVADHPYPKQVLVIVAGETSMDEMMNFIVTTRTGDRREVAFLFEVSTAAIRLSSDEVRMLATYAADESLAGGGAAGAAFSGEFPTYAMQVASMAETTSLTAPNLFPRRHRSIHA
jgi:hypothetical protein